MVGYDSYLLGYDVYLRAFWNGCALITCTLLIECPPSYSMVDLRAVFLREEETGKVLRGECMKEIRLIVLSAMGVTFHLFRLLIFLSRRDTSIIATETYY